MTLGRLLKKSVWKVNTLLNFGSLIKYNAIPFILKVSYSKFHTQSFILKVPCSNTMWFVSYLKLFWSPVTRYYAIILAMTQIELEWPGELPRWPASEDSDYVEKNICYKPHPFSHLIRNLIIVARILGIDSYTLSAAFSMKHFFLVIYRKFLSSI